MTWYALRVIPQKERAAHMTLSSRGFTSFFPHEVREVRRLRHRRHYNSERVIPLLTGYALARHDGSHDWWHRVFRLNMITSVVGIAGIPHPIPEAAIERLAVISGQRVPLPSKPVLKQGQQARVVAGPFAGFECRVEDLKGNRATILLSLFGRVNEVPIEADKLEAA